MLIPGEGRLQVLNMWMQLLLSDQDKDESCCPFAAIAETLSCMDRSYKWARRSAHTSVAAHGSGPVPSASPPVAWVAVLGCMEKGGVQSCVMNIKSTVFLNTRCLIHTPPLKISRVRQPWGELELQVGRKPEKTFFFFLNLKQSHQTFQVCMSWNHRSHLTTFSVVMSVCSVPPEPQLISGHSRGWIV